MADRRSRRSRTRQCLGIQTLNLWEYESTVLDSKAGILLPNVRMLAAVHDWSAALDTEYEQGVRVVVSGTGSVSRSGDDQ
jgi:hypothetical protein